MKANARARTWCGSLFITLCLTVSCHSRLNADEKPPTGADHSAQAKALAIRAHAQASAIDRLPRFSIRAQAGTVGEGRIENPSPEPLKNLLRALDKPTTERDWFRFLPTFAWDEDHFWVGIQSDEVGQFFWGTRDLAGERGQGRDRPARHVLRSSAWEMWKNRDVSQPNYLLATRHEFWWGDNSYHNQHFGSGVPPSHSVYHSLGAEEFDGELCDVVESHTREERLWISQETRLIRGFLQSMYKNQESGFSVPEAIKEITGRSFSSRQEYTNWYFSEFDDLPSDKKWQVSKAWSESRNFDEVVPFMLVRFRDFREISPGIWWPYREDRSQGFVREDRFEYMRSEYLVDEVRTDVDLTEIVNGLQPKAGERVQDQRYAEIVNYDYRADRTEAEILELVAEAHLKRIEDEEALNQLKEPVEKLVGHPAPRLPKEGWVGGEPPQVAGHPYLVHFWATWCGPCKNDLPLLAQMAEQGAMLVGMHPAGTPAEDVAKVIEDANLGYPTFVAPQGRAGRRMIAGYPASMYPYYVLVDAQGNVAAHGSLRESNAELLGRFRELREQAGRAAEDE